MFEGLHALEVAYIAFAVLLLAAAVSDLATLTIPNWLPLGLVFLFPGVAAIASGSVSWSSHLAAAVLVFGIGSALFAFGLMGGGDVKLWSAVALWIGLDQLPLQVAATTVFGGFLALALVLARRALTATGGAERTVFPHMPRILRSGAPVPYGLAISFGALVAASNGMMFTQ